VREDFKVHEEMCKAESDASLGEALRTLDSGVRRLRKSSRDWDVYKDLLIELCPPFVVSSHSTPCAWGSAILAIF
jgi:hypothetical protein